MQEELFEVYLGNADNKEIKQLLASNMSLDSAILFTQAYLRKYYNAYWDALIVQRENPKCNEDQY